MKNSLIACLIPITCASVGFFAPVIALITSDAASASIQIAPVTPLPGTPQPALAEAAQIPPPSLPAPAISKPSNPSPGTAVAAAPEKSPAPGSTPAASPASSATPAAAPSAPVTPPAAPTGSSTTPSAPAGAQASAGTPPAAAPASAPSTAIAAPGPATVAEGVTLTPSQKKGMELFNSTAFCFTCHSIGRGKVIGPDLANVHERRTAEWLVKFIKSSQAMVNSGDPEAVKIFNEFNKIPMPDPPGATEADILSIIDFIKVASATPGQAPAASAAATPAAEGNAEQGKKLFTGLVGLKNNGPTCIACHQVKDDKAITGGSLALELTLEYSQKGGAPFITNILSTTPFPAMKEAYGKRPLTKDEVADLTAYLKQVDEQHQQQQGRNYGTTLFFSGLLGAVILIVVFPMLWSRRRRGSVNRKIYDRQIKSTN